MSGDEPRPLLPAAEESARGTRDWPHAPPHRLSEAGVYFVTARTRNQAPLLAADAMKDWFQGYVHSNAVHHGLVRVASDWEWCSAAAFERAVSPAWAETIAGFKYVQIARDDGE